MGHYLILETSMFIVLSFKVAEQNMRRYSPSLHVAMEQVEDRKVGKGKEGDV